MRPEAGGRAVTSDQVFIGIGLTLALAVGSQMVGRWLRVPALIISPWARRGFVDSAPLEFSSVLRMIERLHDLPTMAGRDRVAGDLLEAFDFDHAPRPRMVLPQRDCSNVR